MKSVRQVRRQGGLSFSVADLFLREGRNMDRKLHCNNTYIVRLDEDTIAVRFHGSDVVLIHRNGDYTLSSCGRASVTAKARINAYSPACVESKRYRKEGRSVWWYAGTQFYDGMVVDGRGTHKPRCGGCGAHGYGEEIAWSEGHGLCGPCLDRAKEEGRISY